MEKIVGGVKNIFEGREKFIIIGLTGRTGSGCSTAAKILSQPFDEIKPPKPESGSFSDNEERKYRIIYDFAQKNWNKFYYIHVRDIITSFILENSFEVFSKFMVEKLSSEIEVQSSIMEKLKKQIKDDYEIIHKQKVELKGLEENDKDEILNKSTHAFQFYFEVLPAFSLKLKHFLSSLAIDTYTTIYQHAGDNIRSSGSAICDDFRPDKVFTLSKRVNRLIKVLRKINKEGNKAVFVAIDAIRNPFEASFFRERYSAFYLMAINTPDEVRISRLQKDNLNDVQIKRIDKKEYPKKLTGSAIFYSQNIQKCIELADIHINNPYLGNIDLTYLKRQLIWYLSLIMHPGLVMPSRVERLMQTAYSAKLNSGCISRQVGAVIADSDFSIKAVGWNSPAQGQVPCLLRNIENLLNHEDKRAFSLYENNNDEFRDTISSLYRQKLDDAQIRTYLNGRNVSFCFKDVQNQIDGEKNQVHTRALHAEENAFLQITKYGGTGINNGILFTTASPCELCAKKAYQLGVKNIYFIDPYPGITTDHIVNCGEFPPKLILFNGAVGRAYYQLYEPKMSHKDELSMLIDIQKPNLDLDYTNKISSLEEIIRQRDAEILILKASQGHVEPKGLESPEGASLGS